MINIVFNLYPFQEGCFLPSAYLVQDDRSGLLTHIVQRATPLTANSHQIQLSDSHKRLLELIEQLSPKALEARFKAPKAKAVTPLAKLLTEKETKGPVEAFIHRQLDIFLSEIQRCKYPLTLDAERKTLVKDVLLAQLDAPLIPWLSFDKTPEGITYRLQLGTETERWQIGSRDVTPLTNTDPAWIIADYAIFRVPGINGNMVKPFRQKNEVLIPKDKEKMYFRQFIAKSIRRSGRRDRRGMLLEYEAQLMASGSFDSRIRRRALSACLAVRDCLIAGCEAQPNCNRRVRSGAAIEMQTFASGPSVAGGNAAMPMP